MNPAENYTYRYLETDDLDQYNALLRYTFQVTEDELTATGWKDDEIKQSKFPVLERADVLGCFDGENLVSQFAVTSASPVCRGRNDPCPADPRCRADTPVARSSLSRAAFTVRSTCRCTRKSHARRVSVATQDIGRK